MIDRSDRFAVRRLLCAAALCASVASIAHADPVVTNLGTGDGYTPYAAWIVSGSDSSFGEATEAMGFTSNGNYDISEIDAWISGETGGETFTLSLWTNEGGNLGTLLGSWSNLASNFSGFGATGAPVAATGLTGITLTQGGQYYLQASAEGSNMGFWLNSTNGVTGPVNYPQFNYTVDYTQSAFAMQGTEIAASGAVPEPASWALMLGGFGLVGGALRSRRKAAVRFA